MSNIKLPSVVSTLAFMMIKLQALLNGIKKDAESLAMIGSKNKFECFLFKEMRVDLGCVLSMSTIGLWMPVFVATVSVAALKIILTMLNINCKVECIHNLTGTDITKLKPSLSIELYEWRI